MATTRYRPKLEVLEDRCVLNFSLQVGPNVNTTRPPTAAVGQPGEQAEGTIVIDPTDTRRMFVASVNQ